MPDVTRGLNIRSSNGVQRVGGANGTDVAGPGDFLAISVRVPSLNGVLFPGGIVGVDNAPVPGTDGWDIDTPMGGSPLYTAWDGTPRDNTSMRNRTADPTVVPVGGAPPGTPTFYY